MQPIRMHLGFQSLKALAVYPRLARWIAALCIGGWAGMAACAAEPVRVLTEEFPPYNYTENSRITGLSTEVVEAVFKELGLQGQYQSMPWARAYETARTTPGVLIYSIGRTPERDKLFKWVGVIAPTVYYLYGHPGRSYRVDSLEAAKNYQIGTVNEDVGEQFLVKHGFVKGKNLQSSVKYEHNYEKLKAGRVDLWIMSELTASYLARQAGDDPRQTLSKVYRIPELSSEGYYMAFGAQTPDATVESFRKALDALRSNGTYDRLQRKWQ